jgi:hypothetical protein
MMASAAVRLTRPSAANELVISAVAVLLWSSAVRLTRLIRERAPERLASVV